MSASDRRILGIDEIVEINLVQPNTWNPKDSLEDSKENKERYEEIKTEIKNKGLFEAITVRELPELSDGTRVFEILDGFHRWTACKELGFHKIRINNLGKGIDDEMAMAITVVKEEKKVPISQIKLSEVVVKMYDKVADKAIVANLLGYPEVKVDEYLEMAKFDWDSYKKTDKKDDDKNGTVQTGDEKIIVKCPECSHAFEVTDGVIAKDFKKEEE